MASAKEPCYLQSVKRPGVLVAPVMPCAQRQAPPPNDILAVRRNLWLPSEGMTAKHVALGEALHMDFFLSHLYLAQMKNCSLFSLAAGTKQKPKKDKQ